MPRIKDYLWSLWYLKTMAIMTCDECEHCIVCGLDHRWRTFLNRQNYCEQRKRDCICGELEMLKEFVQAGGVLDGETIEARMNEIQAVGGSNYR